MKKTNSLFGLLMCMANISPTFAQGDSLGADAVRPESFMAMPSSPVYGGGVFKPEVIRPVPSQPSVPPAIIVPPHRHNARVIYYAEVQFLEPTRYLVLSGLYYLNGNNTIIRTTYDCPIRNERVEVIYQPNGVQTMVSTNTGAYCMIANIGNN